MLKDDHKPTCPLCESGFAPGERIPIFGHKPKIYGGRNPTDDEK